MRLHESHVFYRKLLAVQQLIIFGPAGRAAVGVVRRVEHLAAAAAECLRRDLFDLQLRAFKRRALGYIRIVHRKIMRNDAGQRADLNGDIGNLINIMLLGKARGRATMLSTMLSSCMTQPFLTISLTPFATMLAPRLTRLSARRPYQLAMFSAD